MTGTFNNKIKTIAVIIVTFLLIFAGCKIQKYIDNKNIKVGKVITKDSISIVSIPTPYFIIKDSIHTEYRKVHDTITVGYDAYNPLIEPHDRVVTEYIVPESVIVATEDYYSTKIFKRDTTVGRYHIGIYDTLRRNAFKGSRISISSSDTSTNTVITIPNKTVLSFTLSGMTTPLFDRWGVGAGLMLKLPNDKTYKFEVKKIQYLPLMGEVTAGFPIRLHNLFNKPKRDTL